jgi:hypothetical protein
MCESPVAFQRGFCRRRWESAPFADFHGRVIFHKVFYPQISLKTQNKLWKQVDSEDPAAGAGYSSVAACADLAPRIPGFSWHPSRL